ncbi:UvrD-helicase domain-containing protein [Simiduia curdlanivorans]|uniref:DNA 3'-5' helicase n=1 Tax=Simiduia curdlanivorans TaxID=1492769 RepID=A0ABV8V7U0_9GAMM|nr:UvrD-helicase domain-containing protein [Simiduia curdlanivorans]MDN3639705.1 UvrD-helicase domain-containing protein [Simiduia curdlanivorans]
MNQTQPIDAKVRARALDPTASFAVTAPAGSGKTGLLTQRVLRLLHICDNPEEVLAITFTRKAAGEMRERITQALNQAQHHACPENPHDAKTWQLAKAVLERDQQLGWQLIQSPNRLRIQTIDGLSRQLAKQLPFDSGMGSLPEPSDQPEPLYRAAVLSLFQKLESDDPIADDIALILSELDNRYDTFEALLLSLLRQRDQWLGLTLAMRNAEAKPYLEKSLQSLIINELEASFKVLLQHELSLCELARYAAANLLAEQKSDPLTELAELNQLAWDVSSGAAINQQLATTKALLNLLLTKDGGWRKRLDKNMGFPPERAPDISKQEAKAWKERLSALIEQFTATEGLLERFRGLRALPQATYSDAEWQLLDALTRLLPYLAAELTVVFSREGCSDFIDTAQAALTALGNFDEPSELALKLDYHIKHILIDEFQDTSVPQRRLIELLTAGWEPEDGRTLFIVGDGMQSCYGFRNAKVGIFLQARSQGIGNIRLEPLDLVVNFRSQQGVVDWVNAQFAQAFPLQDDITRGNVAYYPSQAIKPALGLAGAQLTLLAKAEPSAASQVDSTASQDHTSARQDPNVTMEIDVDLGQAEAEHILALIQRLKGECPTDSIALLARTRSHLRETLRQLDLAGIRYQASELDNLAGRMAVQDLQTLLRALLDPTDRISWLGILRAPWCGLDNGDLLALVQHPAAPLMADGQACIWQQMQDHSQIEALSDAGRQALARTVAVLQQSLEQRARKPLRDWLEGCWLALGGQASLIEASDIANCQTFLDLLEAHSHGGQVRHWQTFEEAVARLYAAPAPHADPLLQVMTIHKSKGLEFDHVIIPGLHKRPRADSRELLVWLDQIDAQGEQQILLSPLSNFETSELYSYIQGEKSARTRTEATRLFYVGATRAIKQLHLFACVNQKGGELVAPSSSSLLASIWDGVRDQAKLRFIQPKASQHRSQDQTQGWIRRLPGHWQLPQAETSTPLADYRGRSQAAEQTRTAAHELGQSGDLFAEPNPAMDQEDLNRPDLNQLFEADSRAIGTLLHSAIQAFTEAGQIPSSANIAPRLKRWQLHLKQAGVADPARGAELIQTALLSMAASDKGRWLLDHSHTDSACELDLWASGGKDPAGQSQPKLWVIDRTFIDQGVRWVVDYKSAKPAADQSMASFLAEQTAMHQAQLQNYVRLVKKLGPEPVRSALYFPLCDQFAPLTME